MSQPCCPRANTLVAAVKEYLAVIGIIGLAMRHRLQWFIHLRDRGLTKRDEQPAYTLLVGTPNTFLHQCA